MPDLGDDDLKALHARLEELGPMPSARCSRATTHRIAIARWLAHQAAVDAPDHAPAGRAPCRK